MISKARLIIGLIIPVFVLLLPVFVSADLSSGLVAYYPFNGNANDESGNGHHGTVNGAVLSEDRFGIAGGAYRFDGYGAHIMIDHSNDLNFLRSEDFSLVVWVRIDSIQNTHNWTDNDIVSKWRSYLDVGYPYVLRYFNQDSENWGHIYVARHVPPESPSPGGIIISSRRLDDNQFHHIVFEKQNTTLSLYIDGLLDGVVADLQEGDTTNELPLTFGIRTTDFASYFNGVIDEVRIYNRSLTEAEIQELYGQSSDGLVAHWSFDNCDATDDSGNGHNGTIYGNPQCVDGEKGKAFRFDGVSDWIDVGPDTYFPAVTVSAFIKLDSTTTPSSTADGAITVVDGWKNRENFLMKISSEGATNKFHSGYHDSIDYQWVYPEIHVFSSTSVLNNIYYHVALSYDGNLLKLYVNGQLEGTVASEKSNPYFAEDQQNPDLRLGIDRYDLISFKGDLDEVRIYNRHLSEAEIQALYGEGSSIFFEDNFEGTSIDVTKWTADIATDGQRWCDSAVGTANGPGAWVSYSGEPCQGTKQSPPFGLIDLSDGSAHFSSSSSRAFPYLWVGPPSKPSPFPESGDFTLELRLRYDAITVFGTGFAVRYWQDSEPTGSNPPGNPDQSVFGIWADNSGFFASFLKQAYFLSNPYDYHIYQLDYKGGKYSLSVDCSLIAGPLDSNLLPNAIWLGNPVAAYWWADNWTGFTVDFVRVMIPSQPGDSDTDGLPDSWERQHFGDLVQNPSDDYDHDELTNLQEYQLGTDPTKWDTDGDGLNDGDEVSRGTDPNNPDTDGDGVNDGTEVAQGTDLLDPESSINSSNLYPKDERISMAVSSI